MTDTLRFTDVGLEQDLADALGDRGIVHPFPIQELTLPLAFKGHDIIGQARTGTGKTLGFGLPLLQRIDPGRNETQALVIVPTRELCVQVEDDLTVGAARGITSIAVYGGVGYDEQIAALTGGVHVVVGTPGRTIDHLNRGNLDVSKIHTVVLDEADEMLDMGFLPDVERLLADVPTDRQTLLFSATMPTEIVKLARRFMDKPTFMRADETLHETAPTVEQHFFLVHRMDKPRVLARIMQQPDRGGAFVFCRTKRMCDRLVQELDDLGVSAIAVHGDKRQAAREKNMDTFRAGKADVLVATEVAARGLDVSNVTHVINYDCPDDEKMYLHRIGRTARAGESGVAVTFAQFNEVDRVNVIRKRVDAEEELVEVFSTSDELTELFDLPATTPWDDLGSGDGGSSRSTSRSSSRGSSSGRSRSSGRGSDGGSRSRSSSRRRSGSSTDQAREERTSSRESSSRRRSRTRSRTAVEAVVADAKDSRDDEPTAKADEASDGSRSSRRRGGRDGGSRSNAAATKANDTSATAADSDEATGSDPKDSDSTGSNGSKGGSSRGGRSRGDDTPTRTTGGARPRARRNRGGSSTDKGSASGTSRDRGGSRDRANTGGRDRGTSSSRSGSDGGNGSGRGSSNGRSSKRSGNGDRTRSGSGSGKGSRSGNGSGRARTTRRGDEARGSGRPRPQRRVEVEHLP